MMRALIFLLPCLPLGAGETILGVYIFHRHGDRTTKSYPPVLLTSKGVEQSRSSGSWYRNRYVSEDATAKIYGLSSDIVDLTQLSITSPVDDVLQNSAQAFLQGLYPPLSMTIDEDGPSGPLDGYQFIPVNTESLSMNSAKAEDNMLLQAGSTCPKAIASSQSYLESSEYHTRLNNTKEFYQTLLPVYEKTFPGDGASFKNAYVYDLVYTSTISDDEDAASQISQPELVTSESLSQLYTLASEHEWGLAFNSSEPIRAVAGSVLAGQIVQKLNTTLHVPLNTTSPADRLTIQFGPYATFMSFFGLAQLTAASPVFHNMVDYASSFVVELLTDVDMPVPSLVNPDDAYIRFRYVNYTSREDDLPPAASPLFGQRNVTLMWSNFVDEMSKFSIADTPSWCAACNATEGICVETNGLNGSLPVENKPGPRGMSTVVAGVNGAVITLVVLLVIGAVAYRFGGLRVIKKNSIDLSASRVAQPKTSRDTFSSEQPV